jgi:hypothetical protein
MSIPEKNLAVFGALVQDVRMSKAVRNVVYGLGIGAGIYLALAAVTWIRFGSRRRDLNDSLLDHFLPVYDIVEQHEVAVNAPAETTFAAACEVDLQQSRVIRAIFKARETLMGSTEGARQSPAGFLGQMRALGWGVLAEVPGREIVMGAATKPWTPNPVFEPVPADEFAAFNMPDHVKIVWTLRADPITANRSVFRTQTRAIATDEGARSKFRLYWSFVSPGVNLIRRMSLGLVKSDAERLAGGSPVEPFRSRNFG